MWYTVFGLSAVCGGPYQCTGVSSMVLKIALLQLLPGRGLEEQYRIGREACEKAKAMGADIALFPEMWSCGYTFPQNPEALRELAIHNGGEFVESFGALAAELDMAIGITYLERHFTSVRNTITLFDRNGDRRITYAKVHTCAFGDERVLTPGNDFFVVDLDTAAGPVKVGCMICYDREFPESARILMLKGAEVVLVPNACPMEINRLSQLRARAFENMLGIATCNYPAGQLDCNGHSSAFDGVAWLPDGPGSRDMCVLGAGEEPGIYMAEFDLDLMRGYRSREVHGDKYRRPDRYHLLVEDKQ